MVRMCIHGKQNAAEVDMSSFNKKCGKIYTHTFGHKKCKTYMNQRRRKMYTLWSHHG